MKRKIVTDLNALKQKSEEVIDKKEIDSILKDLEDSLDLSKGIGLSAIQIGIPKRIAIIRIGNFYLRLINPEILEKSEIIRVDDEGCLSLPGIYVSTKRYKYISLENNNEYQNYKNIANIAIQHEIDHMNGKTILDRKWKK